jgi:hypothetical protein
MIPKNLIETTELVFDICGFSSIKVKEPLALVNLSLMELLLLDWTGNTNKKIGQFVTFLEKKVTKVLYFLSS